MRMRLSELSTFAPWTAGGSEAFLSRAPRIGVFRGMNTTSTIKKALFVVLCPGLVACGSSGTSDDSAQEVVLSGGMFPFSLDRSTAVLSKMKQSCTSDSAGESQCMTRVRTLAQREGIELVPLKNQGVRWVSYGHPEEQRVIYGDAELSYVGSKEGVAFLQVIKRNRGDLQLGDIIRIEVVDANTLAMDKNNPKRDPRKASMRLVFQRSGASGDLD